MATRKKPAARPISSFDDLDAAGIGAGWQPMVQEPERELMPAAPESRGMLRGTADLALELGSGAIKGIKFMSDAAGADNPVSGALADVNTYVKSLQSAQAKGEDQKIAAIMKEAEDKGVWEQVKAAFSAAGEAPIRQSIGALSTGLPIMAASMIPGVREASWGARLATMGGLGATQGAGIVKSTIYDEVKQRALQEGKSESEAQALASKAQSYSGENLDQIAMGAGLNAAASMTGFQPAVVKAVSGEAGKGAARGLLGSMAMGVLKEVPFEAAQGGQEQIAGNVAQDRAGFSTPTFRGAVGASAMEGLLAAPGGAVGGALDYAAPSKAPAPIKTPEQEAADAIRAAEKLPESGTLTKAVNAGVEAKAQAVEAGAPLVDEQATAEPVDDPVRDQILALPDGARQDALRAYAVVNRTDVAKGVQQYNRKLLDRLLAENQPAPVLGERLTDTDMGAMLGGGGMNGTADPLAGALGMNREAQANSITNVARVAESRPPMPASDAARMLDEARSQGVDLAVAEHPGGGFVLVPPQWVEPGMAAQGEQRLNETIARMQQADAAPVDRAPRTRTEPVDLNLSTDPVRNYVDGLRAVNTPATRAFVRDFDAGRLTPADVQQRMQAEQGLSPDQRLARAAAEALKAADPVADRLMQAAAQNTVIPTDILNPQGLPFKTKLAANLAAKKTPGEVVPVEGGFVVRPQEPVNVQDVPQASEVPKAVPAVIQPSEAPQAVGAQPAGPTAGVPAEGAGTVEAAGVEEVPPVDPLGWNAKKLASTYDMAQMNDLYQYVLRNYSNPVVGGGPVENGKATAERFNAEGRKIHAAMQQAQSAIYERTKAKPAAETGSASSTPAPAGAPTVRALTDAAPTQNAGTQAAAAPGAQGTAQAVRYGRNSQPLNESGLPFRTRRAADAQKRLQPMMRVVSVKGGFALAEKTPAQIAAQDRAAQRLRQARTSPKGEPIAAHAFIAAAGGMNQGTRADMGVDGNPRIGNRRLFAGAGRGLTIEQATEMLVADGYLSEGASHNDAYALITKSLTPPQYNADGIERIAEAEANTQFDDFLAAQEDAAMDGDTDPWGMAGEFTTEELEDAGYTSAELPIQAEVRALIAQADALGIDSESIMLDAHEATRDATTEDYYEAAKSALTAAIEAAVQGGNRDSRQAPGSEGSTREAGAAEATGNPALELTAPTAADITAQQDRAESAAQAEAARKRAADAAAAQDEDRKRIAQASVRAADTFELGQDPLDSLTGQVGMFDAPAAAAQQPAQQPITSADVAAAQKQAADLIGSAIDAMTAQEVQKVAARFLPTMGVKPVRGKANIRTAMVDPKVNLQAAASELGVTLPAEVKRALDAETEGRVVEGAQVAQEPAAKAPVATGLTPKQFHEAKLSFIAADTGTPLSEVRENYDTEAGRAEHDREWAAAVEAAAQGGEVLTRQTLDKLFELSPNVRLPESAIPEGYQRPEARKAEAEEKQARVANRNAAKSDATTITDFGEKIGGAKKDLWTGFKDDLSAVSDADIASQPLSKIWPAPDYQAMIDSGVSPEVMAFVRAARDEVPAKPRVAYKVKAWAGKVQLLRSMAVDLMDGKLTMAQVRSQLEKSGALNRSMQGFMGRVDLYQAVGHQKSLEGIRMAWHNFTLYKGQENVSLWVVEKDSSASAFSNWPRELATGKTKEEAIEAFRKVYDKLHSDKEAKKGVQFDIISFRGESGYWIAKKLGRNHVKVHGPLATVKEAREYRDQNQAALVEKLAKLKEIPNERRDVNEPRVGADMRNGADVTPELFSETFGFRGVEFGNWVEQGRRQQDLNNAFDALMDLSAVLGIPPKAISLNGELGLAFGARGTGGSGMVAAAHYESDKVVINLTKKNGAGSLGHEWWHAVDNYFAKQRKGLGGHFMTTARDVGLSSRGSDFMAYPGVRVEMVKAFGDVVKAINLTSMKKRSAVLDGKRSKEYWTTGEELSARAFEAYLIAKLQDQNASNDYLANILSEGAWEAAAALGLENENSYPYPTAKEVPGIRAAFDQFFQTVQTKETGKGVAMFSRSPATQSTFEARIDALFSDGTKASREGVRVLDSSEVMGLLGHERVPLVLSETHVIHDGRTNHPEMTAAIWKKVPDWIENPAAVYTDPKHPGKLTIVAPERVAGYPVIIAVEPNTLRGKPDHLLVTAFAKTTGELPVYGYLASSGRLLYADTKKAPSVWRLIGDNPRPSRPAPGAKPILTEKQLAGYRRANNPALNLSPGAITGSMTKTAAQQVVDAITSRWANAPEVVVVDSMQDAAVPQAVRDADAHQKSLGATGEPEGFWYKGKVYVVASTLNTPADVVRVMLHESLGHYGLRGVFGKELEKILTQVATMRRSDIIAKAREYGLVRNGPDGAPVVDVETATNAQVWDAMTYSHRQQSAEEVLAEMAQTKPELGFVKRAIAAIRNWLRANVPGFKNLALTDNDIIQQYILPARGWVERGGADGGPRGGQTAMFSRATSAGTVDRVGQAIKSVTATNIKKRAGFKLTDYLGLGLQALGRRQIVDIYGDMLPLAEYNRLVQQMEADKNEGGAEADKLVTQWAKLPDEGKLADLMHDATLAQIDPAEDYADGDDKGQYQMLRRKFNLLSADAKKVYADTRDAYKAHHAKVRSAIKERIERSEIKGERKAALLKQMDDEFFAAVNGVYFPLARFGQYVVTVKGPDGKVESVSRAESKAEAEALRTSLISAFPKDKGFTVGRVILSKEFVSSRDSVGRGFMTELYQVLDKQDMDATQRAELEDTLGQLYLSSLPDLSWAKHGIHRKGTPGFSQDARRAYAQNMFHGSRYLAKLRYSDLMQDELTAMQKHVDDWREVEDFDQNSAQRVVDEMNKRHESLMNPKTNKLSTWMTSLGFVFHLGLSPASAMVNLSQTALVAYPIMGAKWGFGKASAALLKASAEAAKGKNDITASLNADERAAYDEAVRAGTIDVTMAHDLAGIAQGEDAGVMWKIRPVMRWASFLFHHAERFNRQVTFVAAYRLAREAGTDHKTAFEQATKATYDGHFDYGAANRPRIMQGNVAKVLLLFKQYGQNMVYTLARNAQQAIKAETPEDRAQARKALGGLLVMHGMAAGVLGLPMVTTLLAAASMIGGDDDEPWDAKVALQNMLADTFGQKTAEVLAHGLSRLTPWDISGRVGLDKLIFPDIQEGLEGQRLWESAATQALGPVGGIAGGLLKGADLMSEGHYQFGLEAMLPAVLRQAVKSIRYASDGAQDKSGVVIKDEVSAAGVAGQLLGFSPSEVRLAQEGKSAIYQHDKALAERRQELLSKAARATRKKDAEGRADAMKEIERFNQKNPARRITPLNVLQSVRNSQRRIDQAQNGVYLPKSRRDAMEAGRFALTPESSI